jgi:hypothetical protein
MFYIHIMGLRHLTHLKQWIKVIIIGLCIGSSGVGTLYCTKILHLPKAPFANLLPAAIVLFLILMFALLVSAHMA